MVAGILGLLGVLAAFQYNWQRQVSDADREKMQKRVEADAMRFAEDFNREIQGAYFNFQTSADAWRAGDAQEFNEHYDYWKSKTAYPELIREFYFFENKADSPTLTYNGEKRRFERIESATEIRGLRERIIADKTAQAVFGDAYAMVVPVFDVERHSDHPMVGRNVPGKPIVRLPERFGNLVVILDRGVVSERLLPDLVKKYFGDGEFQVSVRDNDDRPIFGSTTAADAKAPLFDLSPDKFVMFAGRDSLRHILGAEREAKVFHQRVESRTLSKTETDINENGNTTFKVELQQGDSRPRTQIIASAMPAESPWTLNVQHRDGSVVAFIDNTFRLNLAIGGGLFSLLAVAILGIFFSSYRAKMFAQRQVDFVSSVSHEFRTPLAVIYSAGENLADGVAKEESQISRYGNLIKGEGWKLSGMVEQILEFAGANSGRQKYNFAKTNVADAIKDAVKECAPLIEAGGFQLETDLSDSLPAIDADAAALSRAVQNLIANSVKYSNGAKWLRVSAENGDGKIRIAVEDKGIGISQKDLRQVFEPFYRSREVVDAQIHGNGLGLSLVKQIVEAHGGKVFARSEPGKGSTFTIEFPQK